MTIGNELEVQHNFETSLVFGRVRVQQFQNAGQATCMFPYTSQCLEATLQLFFKAPICGAGSFSSYVENGIVALPVAIVAGLLEWMHEQGYVRFQQDAATRQVPASPLKVIHSSLWF